MHEEYRDFEPGSPLKSYLRVTHAALFNPQRFFGTFSGSRGYSQARALSGRELRLGAALFALPTTWGWPVKSTPARSGPRLRGKPSP